MNNLSRARTYTEQRDTDVQFHNEQHLHGEHYSVPVGLTANVLHLILLEPVK